MPVNTIPSSQTRPYIGRFAPSPSGPLHFGSLIAALGSFLQARARQGRWLVRIEDIDPPREMAGAAPLILQTLEAHGLQWDGEVMYQSRRHSRYDEIIDQLYRAGDLYWCRCTRREIMASGGFYNGHCRTLGLTAEGSAARVRQHHPVYDFVDGLQGRIAVPAALAEEDFIVRRRDGLYAYNLAVVVDDMDCGITEIVRGADLLEPTVRLPDPGGSGAGLGASAAGGAGRRQQALQAESRTGAGTGRGAPGPVAGAALSRPVPAPRADGEPGGRDYRLGHRPLAVGPGACQREDPAG